MIQELFADVLFTNAKALTVNKNNDIVTDIAVKGNKIIFVGNNQDAKAYIGSETKVIDAKGKTVMPGFIDAHLHCLLYGLLGEQIINVDYNHVDSIEDIKKLIKEAVKTKKKGEWIKLSGYDHNKLAEKRHPSVQDLDEVAPDNPVQCARCCAHMGVYNSAALKEGNVSSPEGFAPGEVVTDENGNLTGLLKETAHMYMSTKVGFSDEEILAGLKNCSDLLLSFGVTTAHDAGAYGALTTRLMLKASMEGIIDIRIRPMIFDMFGKESNIEYINKFLETGIFTNLGNEKFTIGPVKIMTDGSSSGPSSATIEPYSHDPNNSGILVWEQKEVEEMLKKCHLAGFQTTAHAVGDRAVTNMVTSYENILNEYPKENHRHRIEHCGITNEGVLEKIKKLGIVPVSNPSFITLNAPDYNRFYGDRVNYMFPLKSYVEKGIITAIGSDAPITVPNPMMSIYGALLRRDFKTLTECGPNQKVDIMDIIRMFTINGAYVSFEEDIKGSLEVGKLADIIMLEDDILTYNPEDILNLKVKITMVDGKIVYER